MIRRPKPSRHATAAVELALILPFMMLLLGGTVDFARIYHTSQVVQHAAIQAARRAAQTAAQANMPEHGLVTETLQLVGTVLRGVLGRLGARASRDTATKTVTVVIEYEFQLITPFLGMNGPLKVSRSATAPIPPVPGE